MKISQLHISADKRQNFILPKLALATSFMLGTLGKIANLEERPCL